MWPIALFSLISGCVVVPNVGPSPFEDISADFEIGATAQEDVRDLLGPPSATYMGNTEYLYSSIDWLYFVGIGSPVGVDAESFDKEYFLWMSFDDQGILQELIHSEQNLPTYGPFSIYPIVAHAFSVGTSEIEGTFGAWRSFDRGCGTFSSQIAVADKPDEIGVFAYGPQFLGFAVWSSGRYNVRWKLRYKDVAALTFESFPFRVGGCIVIDCQSGRSFTFTFYKADSWWAHAPMNKEIKQVARLLSNRIDALERKDLTKSGYSPTDRSF